MDRIKLLLLFAPIWCVVYQVCGRGVGRMHSVTSEYSYLGAPRWYSVYSAVRFRISSALVFMCALFDVQLGALWHSLKEALLSLVWRYYRCCYCPSSNTTFPALMGSGPVQQLLPSTYSTSRSNPQSSSCSLLVSWQ